MFLIDLDSVDWTKAPEEFAGYASIEEMKRWLRQQPGIIAFTLTNSQNPLIKSKALETAMDLNRLFMDLAQLIGYQNALEHNGGNP